MESTVRRINLYWLSLRFVGSFFLFGTAAFRITWIGVWLPRRQLAGTVPKTIPTRVETMIGQQSRSSTPAGNRHC